MLKTKKMMPKNSQTLTKKWCLCRPWPLWSLDLSWVWLESESLISSS